MRWIGKMNTTNAKIASNAGVGGPVDSKTLDWEADMLEVFLNSSLYPSGLKFAPNVARSFGDIASSTILGDVNFISGGLH